MTRKLPNNASAQGQLSPIVFAPKDNGIYHDWSHDHWTTTDSEFITTEMESIHCDRDGDLDRLLANIDEEDRRNMEELWQKSPPEEVGGVDICSTAYAAHTWLGHLRYHLKGKDADNASRAAFWLGITLERVRVERLEHFALGKKESKKNLGLGSAARRRKAAEKHEQKRKQAEEAVAAAMRGHPGVKKTCVMKHVAKSLGIHVSTLYKRRKRGSTST